eukprot:TRINITY_DN34206_c0_g1_i1.p1 TRINITY_DN34206_c0_g1~~TRINITY_DN34206_c0_g1_i1.p1  ORF type:complete len:172 (-),score=30.61 TRINITY_DN34206_c0_g1_i1:92-607(-)
MNRSESAPLLSSFTSKPVDSLYVSKFLPYTGAPDTGRLMAMHPLSDVRKGCTMPDVSMKEIWARRRRGNFIMQNSSSESYVSEAASPEAAEFTSVSTLDKVKTKHTRSRLAPVDKFKTGKVSSTAIGWHVESDHGKTLARYPQFGIAESKVTKNYVNMKATNMEACLRLCK